MGSKGREIVGLDVDHLLTLLSQGVRRRMAGLLPVLARGENLQGTNEGSGDRAVADDRFAERGGHIPGAVNLDWMQTMDRNRGLRFKPAEELRAMLASLGVTPDKEVVCYCQSHHRSAHSCMMLKSLGYPRVRGYPGSWSEWGNSPDTPIE